MPKNDPLDYGLFKAIRADLESAHAAAVRELRTIPGVGAGQMGLTPDAVKFSPEFRACKSALDVAAARLRSFNGAHAARFAKEIRADIATARAARLETA